MGLDHEPPKYLTYDIEDSIKQMDSDKKWRIVFGACWVLFLVVAAILGVIL